MTGQTDRRERRREVASRRTSETQNYVTPRHSIDQETGSSTYFAVSRLSPALVGRLLRLIFCVAISTYRPARA